MPLEATMMIIDNSEYMRNGDYIPSRFRGPTKIDSNPENTVGVMTMASKGPEVLVTHSKDIGQIIKALHVTSSKIGGSIDIPTAINIAQLALKHRENKNLRQRIIVFVGSPLQGQGADEREMVKLAKRLKKNNVAVDFIAFGDGVEEETNVLKAFVDNTTNSDNSHLVSVPPGTHLLSDVIISSSILSEDRGIPPEAMGDVGGASGSGGANFEFGVDPSLDPELALALRMSMEEEQARQAAEEQTRQSATDATPQAESAGADKDEEAMLAQALAMSERNDVDMGEEQDEDMDEEEAIARAIQMSMKQEEKEQGGQ
ncbi:uncharacterized protein F5891DRAFT_1165784 [Suillus fuscotomentosus]|uniref:VWFA domain-containing protein n=1 Tax=Suillus fuscotomentosus TaxID=1912939 RepID=A0AAD4DXV9_9AGAM|nr:uncharacterized protein F5891DRAFT_1165784 [Suillus fuscotomentosus]KAG1895895.1 hypothetical protein F5891DRAFT_1165784 [Suillus fuscotomentosus]